MCSHTFGWAGRAFSLYEFTKIYLVCASNQSIGNRHDTEVSHKLTPQTEKCVICKKPKSLSRSPSVDNSSLQRVNWSRSLLSEKCKKAQDKATKMFVDVVVAQHQGKSSQFSSERERIIKCIHLSKPIGWSESSKAVYAVNRKSI